ncbi:MAG: prolyl oligopeptidase family serine peptidase [Gemmataceae bacterium]
MPRCLLTILGIFLVPALPNNALAGAKKQTSPVGLDKTTQQTLDTKMKKLAASLRKLKRQGLSPRWRNQIEIHHKAASWIIKHNEFYNKQYPLWTIDVLNQGLLRARLAAEGQFNWVNTVGYPVIRSYRSRVDGSLQPYAVTLPKDYGKDPKRKWPLHVVLHGRDSRINEVKFIYKASTTNTEYQKDFVRLDVYGRGNNAYRWAGESDVLEAFQDFLAFESQLGRARLIDGNQVVLRGFSMGGAGTWHIGLHMPDRWAVIGPGAGFVRTHGYIRDLPKRLPPWQEKCLTIYDAYRYATNAYNVPIVSYNGENDRQRISSEVIRTEFMKAGMMNPDKLMKLLVAPGLGHRFPLEWQLKAEKEYAKAIEEYASSNPKRVRFVTYTLAYPRCHWVEILSLGQHYTRALVDAKKTELGFEVETNNVTAMHLQYLTGQENRLDVNIDGQKLLVRPLSLNNVVSHIYLLKDDNGHWKSVRLQYLQTLRQRGLYKVTRLQGPIDDAFKGSFLCVRGTGKGWHKATQDYTDARLKQFAYEWSKWWRGSLPIKNDVDVTATDIAQYHLVLFGDPSSNSLINEVVDALPVQWDAKQLRFGGKTYDSSKHIPAMIYPSPLNANRYVVLNSGHTFHEPDYRGTNAYLYPRLGDYAVLRIGKDKQDPLAVDVKTAGVFGEQWELRETKVTNK